MEENNSITSFQGPYPFIDPFLGKEGDLLPSAKAKGIWETLRGAIEKRVKKDGVKEEALEVLPGVSELKEDFIRDAVETIYHDVAEFYSWYFNADDDRTIWIGEKVSKNRTLEGELIPFSLDVPQGLRGAVAAVVADNLEAMREVGEVPVGQDTDSLGDVVTDSLTRYITNWSSWYYDRRELEAIDSYFEQKSVYEDIYLDDKSYGYLGNILDDGQFDGVSDVPYIFEEEGDFSK